MFTSGIHSFFSFGRLFRLLISMSIVIQLIIISYNHISGFYLLTGLEHFILRMLRGTILSLLAAFLMAYPNLYMIRYLNKAAPWGNKIFRRVALQLGIGIFLAFFISILITLLANTIHPYTEDLKRVLIINALIYAVVNIILIAILEGWIHYIESNRARMVAESLREELSQIRFEVLKSQINPHFMFNSLNVLSGLITKDIKKAQQFIDEFSQIYRYVLETIEQPVINLGRELDFARSYLFLQQIRYGESLIWEINIPADKLDYLLPPLSLQGVLENTMKHNIVNENKPLKIDIYCEGNVLIVKNNLQPKISSVASTGIGLKNMAKRYSMIGKHEPVFKVETNAYIARLPLIANE